MVLLPIVAAAAPLAVLHSASAFAPFNITPQLFTDPASNTCATDATCSLRGAILKANGIAGSTVHLLAGTYHLAINQSPNNADDGSSGDLEILADMTVQGAGAGLTTVQVDADVTGAPANDRAFEADNSRSAVTATISDLKVTGGHPLNPVDGEGDGGGILNDGGAMTLHNVIATGNSTRSGVNDGGGSGGGLASNNGVITVSNSTFSSNVAFGSGGGISNSHFASGADSFTNLFVSGNTSNGISNAFDAGGGGIYNEVGPTASATFMDVMITGNHATNMNGGGIYENSAPTATLRYDNITLSGNDALFLGGGFYDGQAAPAITNSTITGNRITGGANDTGVKDGGGVAVGITPGSVTLNNDTISANQAALGTGGGIYLGRGELVSLHNTLVVSNTGTGGTVSNCHPFSNASIATTGHNLANDATCNLTGSGDRQGAQYDPQLAALAVNQGPADGAPTATQATLTEALPAGSIAINTADNTNCPKIDEQHVTRPQQAICDVGAFEFVPAPAATPNLPQAGGAPGTGLQFGAAILLIVVLAAAGTPIVLLRTARRAKA
jgi:hypothetical protein